MSSSPHHHHHSREKTIRKAQSEEPILKDVKSIKDKLLQGNLTSERVAKQNRGKVASRHVSKRTSPSTVTVETEPQHVHKEGLYWIKTIQKTIKTHTARLSKKLMGHVKSYRKK